MEINDPTHLTGHVCVDASHDEDKYQGFALSGCPEEDRRGDRHLSGTRQRLCVDIYHVIYYVMNDAGTHFQEERIFFVFLPQQLCHPRPTHSLPVRIQIRH